MDLAEQLIDTWQINNRINLYLLEAISPDALPSVSLSKPAGRTVAAIFAHLHNVRLLWMKEATPTLFADLDAYGQGKLEAKPVPDKETLRIRLIASGDATAELLREGVKVGKIKGFKPHPSAFLGYLIAHEGYHRGEIGIILHQAGYPLDSKISFGLWEWGSR
jgi:uncharacterized damage-inducible protein DinB